MYYPLSKIIPDLYTSGNEFQYKDTKQMYAGYYYSAYDGKFFTGKRPKFDAKELVRYVPSQAKNISALAYEETKSADSQSKATNRYTPTPSDEDYAKGYIIRYFIKRVNGDLSTIRELSQEDYTITVTDPLYTRVAMTWKISGEVEDTPLKNGLSLPGVASFNRSLIKIAEADVPGISQYLINPIQFHK